MVVSESTVMHPTLGTLSDASTEGIKVGTNVPVHRSLAGRSGDLSF